LICSPFPNNSPAPGPALGKGYFMSETYTLRTVSGVISKWPRWVRGFCSCNERFDSHVWDDIANLLFDSLCQHNYFQPGDTSESEFLRAAVKANSPVVTIFGQNHRCAHMAAYSLIDNFARRFCPLRKGDSVKDLPECRVIGAFLCGTGADEMSENDLAEYLFDRFHGSKRSTMSPEFIAENLSRFERRIAETQCDARKTKTTFLKQVGFDLALLEELVKIERAFLPDETFVRLNSREDRPTERDRQETNVGRRKRYEEAEESNANRGDLGFETG